MKMDEIALSVSCHNDLQHFIKCYMEFIRRFSDADELNDLACKIMRSFNMVFLAGAQKSSGDKGADITLYEYRVLRMYLQNIQKFFASSSVFASGKTKRGSIEFGSGV